MAEGTVLEELSPAECNHGWLSVGRLHLPAADRLRVLAAGSIRVLAVDRLPVRAAGRPAGQDCTG